MSSPRSRPYPLGVSLCEGGQVDEFASMVKALHTAGIDVVLNVVDNHTAEGNHLATLSFTGTDNSAYHRLVDEDPASYVDATGVGNSLNVRHPAAHDGADACALLLNSAENGVEFTAAAGSTVAAS